MAVEDPAVPGTAGEPPVVVLVPAGGSSRRWEGEDKTAVLLSGVPVLVHVVEGAVAGVRTAERDAGAGGARARALPDRVVVVAPAEHPARDMVAAGLVSTELVWTRERPPGGGPVAALAAGVGAGRREGIVVVVAGDLPFARTALPRLLRALAATDADAAVGVDPSGHRQPLLAAYRAEPLAGALSVPEGPGAPAAGARGRALRDVLAGLRVVEVPVTEREALDVDTPALLRRAEQLLREG